MPWWVQDLVVAGAIAGIVLAAQYWSDQGIAQRESVRDDGRAEQAELLENLRYVRDHAGETTDTGRMFRGMNLSGLDLSYLDLTGADFSGADLDNTKFNGADLSGARLDQASLDGTDFTCAMLDGAYLDANLAHATFDRTSLWGSLIAHTRLKVEDSSLSGLALDDVLLFMNGGYLTDSLIVAGRVWTGSSETQMVGVTYTDDVAWMGRSDPPIIQPNQFGEGGPLKLNSTTLVLPPDFSPVDVSAECDPGGPRGFFS